MLQVYFRNDVGVEVPVNTPITFNETLIDTCDNGRLNAPTSQVPLFEEGSYLVEFNAVIDASATGNVGVQMLVNGDEYPGGRTGLVAAATGAPQSVSFSSIVHVKSGCCCVNQRKTLQFVIEGANANVHLANVVITRVRG